MAKHLVPVPASSPRYQQAKASILIGKRARLSVSVKVTDRGLLAIGVLVSGILLSTALLVRTAEEGSRRS